MAPVEHGASAGDLFLDRAERVLRAYGTRLFLSFLIVLSVLPSTTLGALLPAWAVPRLDLIFLALFAPEFALRVAMWVRRRRERRSSPWEPLFLVADLLALVSFLPLEGMFHDFRLFRLTRMLLLLGYWGEMAADLWSILSGRERRQQVVVLLLLGLVICFVGAIILAEFAPDYDYNQDGATDAADRAFHQVLWWSFRQLPDPGNLAEQPSNALIVIVSVALTFSGLLLFSFLIGLSAGAMDELMGRSREHPVGLRDHIVVLGLRQYSFFLLEELAEIYRKNRKRLRGAVLGPTREPPEYFHIRRLPYAYRQGDPVRVADLERVDVHRAKRVIIQPAEAADPDAQVISAILAARSRSPRALLYADLEHEKNFHAARTAGGPRTQIIGSGPFLGYYVAQNVCYPGVHRLYRELLTTAGAEVYTYLLDADERRRLKAAHPKGLDARALFAAGHRRHAVTLVGTFVDVDGTARELDEMEVLLNPLADGARERWPEAFEGGGLRADRIGGLIAVAVRWEDLRGFAQALCAGPLSERDAASWGASPTPSDRLAAGGGFEALRLELPAVKAENVLICGASPRVPRVIAEMLQFFGTLDIIVLVRDEVRLAALIESVLAALEGFLSGLPRRASGWTVVAAEGAPQLRVEGPGGTSTIRFAHSDWSDPSVLLRHPHVDLSRTDVLLFLPGDSSDASDGTVALDCLRIAHFGTSNAVRFRPGFRVVGMMRDPVKSDLLERRLDEMAGPGAEARFSIISSERLRHHFMVQNIFVRRLNAVYLELLGGYGQHLCRLVPSGGLTGDIDPWELIGHLVDGHQLVPIGFELLAHDGQRATLLDPRRLGPGQRLPWASVKAIYAVGEGQALLGTATRSS
jgi:hypothetical protein